MTNIFHALDLKFVKPFLRPIHYNEVPNQHYKCEFYERLNVFKFVILGR